jgi:hypothetical protein
MWFEKARSLSLIFVITGVEAGDRGRSRRSDAKSTCWPTVGGQGCSCVDTWTSRRFCTPVAVSPPPVPRFPQARPQSVPRCDSGPAGPALRRRETAGQGDVERDPSSRATLRLLRVVVTAGEQAERDLPSLCTSLGTTRRPVDRVTGTSDLRTPPPHTCQPRPDPQALWTSHLTTAAAWHTVRALVTPHTTQRAVTAGLRSRSRTADGPAATWRSRGATWRRRSVATRGDGRTRAGDGTRRRAVRGPGTSLDHCTGEPLRETA